MMTRRRHGADASTDAAPVQARATDADEARYADAVVSRYIEWMRQIECIEATSRAGLGTLLQTVVTRGAAARNWAEWMAVAGTGLQEAVDEAARTQGEWLSALLQCQMEAVKLLLDLGRPASRAAPGGEAELATAWFSPWMAAAALRPVQIA
jgi:hypothetical protein